MKKPVLLPMVLLLSAGVSLFGANIVWVSDAPAQGFSGPGSGMTDQGFITLLQNAGHSVIRYNGPDSQNTLVPQADLDALNTNDLIILGRAGNSAQLQNPQGAQWNTSITKPIIVMSPYFVRPDGNRFGWFTGGTLPDDTPTPLSAGDPSNAAVDFIFQDVPMIQTNTAVPYDELIDRNTSHIQNDPVAGGIVYAQATFPAEGNGALTTAYGIVGFPAGTPVLNGSEILSGYRMYFSGGSRESASGPNSIPLYTGRENFTPTGEKIFLRSVQLAINNGTPPPVDPSSPVGVIIQPVSATVAIGESVTFTVAVTGAAPRTIQWQRDTGDGVTFTNIPDAFTPFSVSSLTISNVTVPDFNQARFRAVVTNPNNSVNSDDAVLTVPDDTTAPVPVSTGSLDGTSIVVVFDELVDTNAVNNTATDAFSYSVDNESVGVGSPITVNPDGKSVTILLSGTVGATYTVKVMSVTDRFGNAIPPEGITISGTNLQMSTAIVGALNPGAANLIRSAAQFDVIAGGLDLGSTSDNFNFLYKTVSGDFDARVRVGAITGTNRLESVAKAILTARQSALADAGAVTIFATPPAPGDNSIMSSARPAAAAATNVLGSTVVPGGIPNAWLRITRIGNAFTTYRSTNGQDWIMVGSTTVGFGPDMLVGVGAVSHRNGQYVDATFENLSIGPPITQPTILAPAFAGGVFSASFASQTGVGYRVEFRDNVASGSWNVLTNIAGDNRLKTFEDRGPVSPTGARFYQVTIP